MERVERQICSHEQRSNLDKKKRFNTRYNTVEMINGGLGRSDRSQEDRQSLQNVCVPKRITVALELHLAAVRGGELSCTQVRKQRMLC